MILNNPRDLLKFKKKDVYWMMNINQEQKWNDVKYLPSVTDQQQLTLVMQQEQQLLFLTEPHEKVLFKHKPDEQFIDYLKMNGIELPEIVTIKTGMLENDQVLNNSSLLIPYIQSEEIEMLRNKISGLEVFGGNFEISKQLNNKYFVRRLMESKGVNVTRGVICNNIEDLKLAYSAFKSESFERCVIKIPYGSSGKGLYIIDNEKSFRFFLNYISRRVESFELLIEGWHTTERSINSQLLIHDDKVNLLAITEQIVDDQGVYQGTNFTPIYKEKVFEEYKNLILGIGGILREKGYSGIIGVDSIIDTRNIIYPVVEINARFTQVTYLLPLVSKLKKKYKFIESTIIQFSSTERFSFSQVRKKLESLFSAVEYKELFIYTYCVHEVDNKTIYRIFILIASDKKLAMNRDYLDFSGRLSEMVVG